MGTIYTGVGSYWKVPGIYVNVELGRALPSAAAGARRVLLIGNTLDASVSGLAPDQEAYQYFYETNPKTEARGLFPADSALHFVPDLNYAAQYFGRGSELFLMVKAAFAANPMVELWAYSLGALSGTQALSRAIQISTPDEALDQDEIPETKSGAIKINILGEKCLVRVDEGDNAEEIADKLVTAVNIKLRDLPYYCETSGTPSSSSSSNTAGVEWSYGAAIRFVAKSDGSIWNGPNGQGVDVSLDAGDTGVMLDGAGTTTVKIGSTSDGGSEGTTSALDYGGGCFAAASVLSKQRFHYIVVPQNGDDFIGDLSVFLTNQADPKEGLRQQGIFGSTSDLATTIAMTDDEDGVNDPRIQCIWAEENHYFPGQLAAAVGAIRSKWEGSDPAVNLCFRQLPGVPGTTDENLPGAVAQNRAISDGITPLVPYGGSMVILRSVTSAANAAVGPVLDTGKVTVSDYIADDLVLKMVARYRGFKLSPDTDAPLPSNVTTPSLIQGSLIEWLRTYEAQGIITRVGELSTGVRVEIDPDVDGRINFEIPEDVVDIFAVGAGNIIQIG